MSEASIVSIIVALIGSLTAIIIKLIEKGKSTQEKRLNDEASSGLKNIKPKYFRTIFYLSIIIALIGMGSLIKQKVFPSKAELSITYPVSNDIIEKTTRVEGTYRNVSKNEKVWIFINPLDVNRFYPQNTSAELDANGKWSALVYFGQDNDSGKKFEVIVTLADKDAVEQIQHYLEDAKNKKDWSGMSKIPGKALIYERKLVTRK